MVVREEGRWFVGVRRLAFPSHVQIDGGLGLGTLHDLEIGSKKLLARRVSGKRSWNGAIRTTGSRFLQRFSWVFWAGTSLVRVGVDRGWLVEASGGRIWPRGVRICEGG